MYTDRKYCFLLMTKTIMPDKLCNFQCKYAIVTMVMENMSIQNEFLKD